MAQTALLANGWQVAIPATPEPYDILAIDPDGQAQKVQVKTCRVREGRGNAVIITGTKSNGDVYTRDECDYFVGVHGDDVYLIRNREITEYWKPVEDLPDDDPRAWRKLTTGLERLRRTEATAS